MFAVQLFFVKKCANDDIFRDRSLLVGVNDFFEVSFFSGYVPTYIKGYFESCFCKVRSFGVHLV